jgi:hypothetical protein
MVLLMEERYVQKGQINGHTWHAGFKYKDVDVKKKCASLG